MSLVADRENNWDVKVTLYGWNTEQKPRCHINYKGNAEYQKILYSFAKEFYRNSHQLVLIIMIYLTK